jgi:hypothetical protein
MINRMFKRCVESSGMMKAASSAARDGRVTNNKITTKTERFMVMPSWNSNHFCLVHSTAAEHAKTNTDLEFAAAKEKTASLPSSG